MLTLLLSTALADSPLTSTDLAIGYPSSDGVRLARDGMSEALLDFLLGDHPLGERIAAVDALGWQGDGRAEQLVAAIAKKRDKKGPDDLQLRDLLPAERVLLAYLLAHDHYLKLGPMKQATDDLHGATPLGLATSGANALPDDFAAQAVVALIDAQGKMDGPWCAVWTSWRVLLERFPESKRNLPSASVNQATEYLKLYEDDCGPTPGAVESPELNQIYALTRMGDRLIAGTQGGVVVWKDDSVEDSRVEKICSSLAVYEGAVYAGCYHRLLRYDGEWTTLSFDDEVREGGSFDVFLDAKQQLVIRQGSRELRMKDGKPAITGKLGEGYDLHWAADGSMWSIDFLAAIERGKSRYPVQSGAYPGRDPRRFYEDSRGRLWVVDFESGFFVYDGELDRFRGAAGLESKASDIAVDVDRGRVWMLHYTQGPLLIEGDEPYPLDLSSYEYLRALHLDRDGTVYVGGWNGIAKVERRDGRFVVTRLAL